jgi:hypothetical protein
MARRMDDRSTTSLLAGRLRWPPLLAALAAAVAAVLALSGVADSSAGCAADDAEKRTWSGAAGDGRWSTAANWVPEGVPTSAEHACLPAGTETVTVDSGANVRSLEAHRPVVVDAALELTDAGAPSSTSARLEVRSGAVRGSSPLTVGAGGELVWSGAGALTGGELTIADGASMTVSGESPYECWYEYYGYYYWSYYYRCGYRERTLARPVTVAGDLGWTGGARVATSSEAVIRTVDGGTFDLRGDGVLQGAGRMAVETGGVLRRSVGVGTATISVPLEADGTVDVLSGQLQLSGGSGNAVHDGAWHTGAGARTVFAGGTHRLGAIVGTGGGVLALNGGDVQVEGAATIDGLNLEGGVLSGTGDLEVRRELRWSGNATARGTGRTTIAAGGHLELTTGSSPSVERLLVVNGTAAVRGHGHVSVTATITVGGLLQLHNDVPFYGGATLKVLPGGELRKDGSTGQAYLYGPIENDGLVSVSSGMLGLLYGGSEASSGTWSTADGAHTYLHGGELVTDGFRTAGTGAFRLTGGTLRLDGAGTVPHGARLELSQGAITGAGALEVQGRLQWTYDSAMRGTGTTTIASGGRLELGGGNGIRTVGRPLAVDGELVSTERPTLRLESGAPVAVRTGGVLRGDMEVDGDGRLRVHPGGLLTRSSGSSTGIRVPFENDGTSDVQAGTLIASAGSGTGTHDGAWRTASGGRTQFAGGTHRFAGLQVPAGGPVQVAGGQMSLDGPATVAKGGELQVSAGELTGAARLDVLGTLRWDGDSTLSGDGATRIAPGARFLVDGPNYTYYYWYDYYVRRLRRDVRVEGTGTWTGGSLWLGDDARLEVAGTFDIESDMRVCACIGSGSVSVLAGGTLRKQRSSGSTTLELPVDNAGMVAATDGGVLRLAGGYSGWSSADRTLRGGTLRASGGGRVMLDGADVRELAAGVRLDGPGSDVIDTSGQSILRNLDTIAQTGRLSISGGRTLALPNSLLSAGSISLGTGSTLTVPRHFQQTSTGILTAVLAGPTAAEGTAGLLDIGGQATLAGRLTLKQTEPLRTDEVAKVLRSQALTGRLTPTGMTGLTVTHTATEVQARSVTRPALSILDDHVVEDGAEELRFELRLSRPTTVPVSVSATTAAGTALADDDYVTTTAKVTFAPGETTKHLAVAVRADERPEALERMTVKLASAVGATLVDNAASGAISDDDGLTVRVGDASVVEGSAGTTDAQFAVTLSEDVPAGHTVAVPWSVAGGTAGVGRDTIAVPAGTLTFAAGQRSGVVTVPVVGDTLVEKDEAFSVKLGTVRGARAADAVGAGWIRDDDGKAPSTPKPWVSVDDVTILEGDEGEERTARFVLELSSAAAQDVSVTAAVAAGSASIDWDLPRWASRAVVVPAGSTTAVVEVPVTGDDYSEGVETFSLVLSDASAAIAIADPSATATILDEEGAPSAYVTDVTIGEGDEGRRTARVAVELSGAVAPGDVVSVVAATASATAVSSVDFEPTSRTFRFAHGDEPRGVLEVPVVGEELVEKDETLGIKLLAPERLELGDAAAVVTVLNDD